MELWSVILAAFITIFSLGLLVVSFSSYLKTKNTKLILIGLVFLILLIRGILFSSGLIDPSVLQVLAYPQGGIFDLLILLLLFIATLKR